MRTGALVFHKQSTPPLRESSAAAGGSGHGASSVAMHEMGAQEGMPSDTSTIESSKQILSTKQIAVEERVASPAPARYSPSLSPGPAACTRSRAAAASPTPPPPRRTPSQHASGIHVASRGTDAVSAGCKAGGEGSAGAGQGAVTSHDKVRVQSKIQVPRAKMGLLIGAQGKTISELVAEAKALKAHVMVPSIKELAPGEDGQAKNAHGVVVLTGPRDAVATLRAKVAAIISGQAPAALSDPLAYIEPYVQAAGGGGTSGASRSCRPVNQEARRLLRLIQKLSSSVPAAAARTESDQTDAHEPPAADDAHGQ